MGAIYRPTGATQHVKRTAGTAAALCTVCEAVGYQDPRCCTELFNALLILTDAYCSTYSCKWCSIEEHRL